MTNGDALVTGARGAQSADDPGQRLLQRQRHDRGQAGHREAWPTSRARRSASRSGFVEHLLLLKGLEKAGLTEKDVELVNVPTNETPQALASGDVDAIGAWQPNSGQALKQVPGSKAIFTSADVPGLIYDALAVEPQSLADARATTG